MLILPWAEVVRRLPRVSVGLILFGVGVAMMVVADLGLGPWDVFHQGLADRTGVGIGLVIVAVGLVLLLAFIPLGEKAGVGTILNALLIGVTVELVLPVLDGLSSWPARLALVVAGPIVIAVGSGLYIGGGLGPGPRDGIMTGLARRGVPLWAARSGIELTVLVVGLLLGGTAGPGTLWFAVAIGPMIGFLLPRLTAGDAGPARPASRPARAHHPPGSRR